MTKHPGRLKGPITGKVFGLLVDGLTPKVLTHNFYK